MSHQFMLGYQQAQQKQQKTNKKNQGYYGILQVRGTDISDVQ